MPIDTISESIHLSKCRPAICNSEDDTIMEEFSHHQKENYAPRHQQPQKIATILRSRSCRDREVLSKYCRIFLHSYQEPYNNLNTYCDNTCNFKSAERRHQHF